MAKKQIKLSLLLCLLNVHFLYAAITAGVIPVKLKCELIANPLGIDVSNPGLSYILKSLQANQRDVHQTAYQIWVSSTPDFKNEGDLWDSKKVMSDQMAYIAYRGKDLISGQKCWWRAGVWDQVGRQSPWSQTASRTMGILNRDDWKANWISAPGAKKCALSPVGFKSADASSGDVTKWVQVDLGKTCSLSEVMLYPMFYADQGDYAFPLRYKVSASDDPTFKTENMIADFTKAEVSNPRFTAVHSR